MTTPGGPYADTRDMYMVHTMLRREFALLPALVRDGYSTSTWVWRN
jgi:hypothetical protein